MAGAGDVIRADYHPSGWPAHQTALIHAGNGKNFIYANDTLNYVWTGTNAPLWSMPTWWLG